MSRKFLIFFRPSSINIILPVPIHPVRMQVRGFNQAEILIRVLSSKCSIEYSFDFLQRVRDTYSQVKLPYDKREENVRDAFEIIDKDFSLRGKNILLIDDVFTTGSTIRECIRVLSKTGVNRVFTMFLARSWKTNF